MNISKQALKNGFEVDMPMLNALGETQTTYAIKYTGKNMFAYILYDFNTDEVWYAANDLQAVVDYCNDRFNVNDVVVD
mgnify:CR=1 FL=1